MIKYPLYGGHPNRRPWKPPLYQSSNFRITQTFQAILTFHPWKKGHCLRGPHPKTTRNSKASSLTRQTVGSHCEGLAPCLRTQGVLSLPREEALKFTLGAPVWALTAQHVHLLNNQASTWFSDNKILRYQIPLFFLNPQISWVFVGL